MTMKWNPLLLTDSYKFTHWLQYPKGTKTVYSYFESRKGEYPFTVFFGLQYYLKEYLTGEVVTKERIAQAKEFVAAHLGNADLFNEKGWEYILRKYNGKLPVSIKAVPEGTIVPVSNVLMTIENTDPACYWLTNYLETMLVQVWYGTTVATISRAAKEVILKYLEETGDPSLIPFKLHDFGFRGVSSVESAGVGGCAHLVNFMGTDTVAGLLVAQDYYGANMAGYSIPAAEHSTITSWGQENEAAAMANMLDKFPKGLVAVVSDSYDIYRACEKIWGKELKDKVLGRDGTVVVRPDSGNPPEVVVKVLDILGEAFGYTTNAKGYRVLNEKIRVIQGDGINVKSIGEILKNMKKNRWSADNLAFGMGGALLQQLNRDTQSFAFKCSSINVDGVEREVFKNPITDSGKGSKAGRLKLVKVEGAIHSRYATFPTGFTDEKDELVEVFRNGKLLKEYRLDEIRKNCEESAWVLESEGVK